MKCSLGVSNFLEESSSIPILLFSSIFLHWSLRNAFLSLLDIIWNSAFRCFYLSFSPLPFTCLLFSAIVRPPQTTVLAFCISLSWGWSGSLPPVQCPEPPSIILQALCLSDPIPSIYLSFSQFSCSVVSDSLRPHESQHARPPCPSPSPEVPTFYYY